MQEKRGKREWNDLSLHVLRGTEARLLSIGPCNFRVLSIVSDVSKETFHLKVRI